MKFTVNADQLLNVLKKLRKIKITNLRRYITFDIEPTCSTVKVLGGDKYVFASFELHAENISVEYDKNNHFGVSCRCMMDAVEFYVNNKVKELVVSFDCGTDDFLSLCTIKDKSETDEEKVICIDATVVGFEYSATYIDHSAEMKNAKYHAFDNKELKRMISAVKYSIMKEKGFRASLNCLYLQDIDGKFYAVSTNGVTLNRVSGNIDFKTMSGFKDKGFEIPNDAVGFLYNMINHDSEFSMRIYYDKNSTYGKNNSFMLLTDMYNSEIFIAINKEKFPSYEDTVLSKEFTVLIKVDLNEFRKAIKLACMNCFGSETTRTIALVFDVRDKLSVKRFYHNKLLSSCTIDATVDDGLGIGGMFANAMLIDNIIKKFGKSGELIIKVNKEKYISFVDPEDSDSVHILSGMNDVYNAGNKNT